MHGWILKQVLRCVSIAGSSAHLAVLTSDQSWQLYNVADLSMPEQRFQLQWQSSRWASRRALRIILFEFSSSLTL